MPRHLELVFHVVLQFKSCLVAAEGESRLFPKQFLWLDGRLLAFHSLLGQKGLYLVCLHPLQLAHRLVFRYNTGNEIKKEGVQA